MKNLLLGYFHTPENKRPEVVRVLGNLIGFSQDEINQVGSGAPPVTRTWVSTLNPFGGAPKSNLTAVKRQDSSVASSLSKVISFTMCCCIIFSSSMPCTCRLMVCLYFLHIMAYENGANKGQPRDETYKEC